MADSKLQYNNYPENLRPKTLKRGEVKRFRVVGSDKARPELLILPNEDFIEDPDTGEYFNIAAIKNVNAAGTNFLSIHIPQQIQDNIVLFGDKREDREIYKFWQRCNYNLSNPYRDQSKRTAYFIEEIDENSDIKKEAKKRRLQKAAVDSVYEMTEKEIRSFLKDTKTDVDILRVKLEDKARENPSLFIKVTEEVETERKGVDFFS
jgi:hypothetical protein